MFDKKVATMKVSTAIVIRLKNETPRQPKNEWIISKRLCAFIEVMFDDSGIF